VLGYIQVSQQRYLERNVMNYCTLEILQCDGHWSPSLVTAGVPFLKANEEAVRVNAEHFTATRVRDDMGHVVLYVLPQFSDVAYPGDTCIAARAELAKFKRERRDDDYEPSCKRAEDGHPGA
jgi:hypothetical protein